MLQRKAMPRFFCRPHPHHAPLARPLSRLAPLKGLPTLTKCPDPPRPSKHAILATPQTPPFYPYYLHLTWLSKRAPFSTSGPPKRLPVVQVFVMVTGGMTIALLTLGIWIYIKWLRWEAWYAKKKDRVMAFEGSVREGWDGFKGSFRGKKEGVVGRVRGVRESYGIGRARRREETGKEAERLKRELRERKGGEGLEAGNGSWKDRWRNRKDKKKERAGKWEEEARVEFEDTKGGVGDEAENLKYRVAEEAGTLGKTTIEEKGDAVDSSGNRRDALIDTKRRRRDRKAGKAGKAQGVNEDESLDAAKEPPR